MFRILIVDDNLDSLDLAAYLLRAAGHDVQAQTDPYEAIRAARTSTFDIVLTDIRMPGMDGMELLRRLQIGPNAATRIVAVTALAMQKDRDRALVHGFAGYITKPIDPRAFAAQIEAIFNPCGVD
jgi:two-component system, cell cycle response regulator DivK